MNFLKTWNPIGIGIIAALMLLVAFKYFRYRRKKKAAIADMLRRVRHFGAPEGDEYALEDYDVLFSDYVYFGVNLVHIGFPNLETLHYAAVASLEQAVARGEKCIKDLLREHEGLLRQFAGKSDPGYELPKLEGALSNATRRVTRLKENLALLRSRFVPSPQRTDLLQAVGA